MANSRSALKRVRKTEAQTARNKEIKSRVKTYRGKVLLEIKAGNTHAAKGLLEDFLSAADKASRNNVISPNKANRLKSALTRRVQEMG